VVFLFSARLPSFPSLTVSFKEAFVLQKATHLAARFIFRWTSAFT
jgi:hypothetical protein